jgi:hypothetical protein
MACFAVRAIKPRISQDTLTVGILFQLLLSCELWNNILGKFFYMVFVCSEYKTRVNRIMTGQELETLAESYLKLEDFNSNTYFDSFYL